MKCTIQIVSPVSNNVFVPQNVTLDVCSLDRDMGLLQQGCDITGGLYLRIPQLQGLLQYLLVMSQPFCDLLYPSLYLALAAFYIFFVESTLYWHQHFQQSTISSHRSYK
jgi:hypothetical protein